MGNGGQSANRTCQFLRSGYCKGSDRRWIESALMSSLPGGDIEEEAHHKVGKETTYLWNGTYNGATYVGAGRHSNECGVKNLKLVGWGGTRFQKISWWGRLPMVWMGKLGESEGF